MSDDLPVRFTIEADSHGWWVTLTSYVHGIVVRERTLGPFTNYAEAMRAADTDDAIASVQPVEVS